MIRQSPLDSPSDDFVGRIMESIRETPETAPAGKPFPDYLKAFLPYALVAFMVLLVLLTSDIPFLNWIPGKNYYLNILVPYFGTLLAGLKNVFSSKYVSFGMLVLASAGLLMLIDRFFSRKTTA